MYPRISVIGLGKLGLCTAACLASAGYNVTGLDIKKEYVAGLKSGNLPFFEQDLEQVIRGAGTNLTFTTSATDAIRNSDISFIIVPTPSEQNGSFSNRFIIDVLERIGPSLKEKQDFFIVNVVSTVMPGSCSRIFTPLLEDLTGKRVGQDIGLAYNPEFIAIGSVIKDFCNPDLVLIGESDFRTGQIIEKIYSHTCKNTPYMAHTSFYNAEITKLALNCYCTMKISFANNIARICDNIPETDPGRICEIMGHDSRIGSKYIKPGLGFGGPCFPRDNEAFMEFTRQNNGFTGLQEAVIKINEEIPARLIKKIVIEAEKFGNCIALLGLAYKPGTYLTECSQALYIANSLADNFPELDIRVYDPLAITDSSINQASTLEECVHNANVAAILTPWPQFLESDWHKLLAPKSTIINFWD